MILWLILDSGPSGGGLGRANLMGTEVPMNPAADGNTVKVHYKCKLEDGTVFDSSEGRDPLEVKLGAHAVIPGLERGLIGMEAGDTKAITVESEDAFGPRREEMILEVNKSDFPEHITPKVGLQLQMQRADGKDLPVTIAKIGPEKITLDGNHPLAGKTVIFELEVLEVA
jgi:FKBP-type peptidyl-prolyl cis-trans isomerase 2